MAEPTKIYKLYDDEFEMIINIKQLKEFAFEQLKEKINTCDDEEIEDDIKMYIAEEYKEKVRDIIKLFPNDNAVMQILQNATDELIIETLKLRYYDVQTIEVR
jgi:oligoribonuclease NrnB/cAMP/cGMP phosphodiesterase (DHH superfamily)